MIKPALKGRQNRRGLEEMLCHSNGFCDEALIDGDCDGGNGVFRQCAILLQILDLRAYFLGLTGRVFEWLTYPGFLIAGMLAADRF